MNDQLAVNDQLQVLDIKVKVPDPSVNFSNFKITEQVDA
jgi:hypothetical protein